MVAEAEPEAALETEAVAVASDCVTGQIVVESTMTSVVLEVEAAVGWQLEAEDGQTVTSEVLVERTVEVVYAASVDAEAVAEASAAVIGQIVVERTTTSVVNDVEAAVGWQLEAEEGQTVTADVLVLTM